MTTHRGSPPIRHGAAFEYLPLWTALFSFPLMTAVQLMCARLGLVTELGLAGVIRRRDPPALFAVGTLGACALSIVANVINIAADLGGMAAVEWSRAFFSVLVAILRTTISPYLFFWQAAQEVEEERALGRNLSQRRGATREELDDCRGDVAAGMFACVELRQAERDHTALHDSRHQWRPRAAATPRQRSDTGESCSTTLKSALWTLRPPL